MSRSEQIKAWLRRAALWGQKGGRPQKVTDAQIKAVLEMEPNAGEASVGLSRAQFALRRKRLAEKQGEDA